MLALWVLVAFCSHAISCFQSPLLLAMADFATDCAALQVAVTTTNDGLGTPYIPYQVDAKLSPNCQVAVRFVAV